MERQNHWDQGNFRVNDRDQSLDQDRSGSSRAQNYHDQADGQYLDGYQSKYHDNGQSYGNNNGYSDNRTRSPINQHNRNNNHNHTQDSPQNQNQNLGWEGGAYEAGKGGKGDQSSNRWPHAASAPLHPGPSTAPSSGYPANQSNPFDDRYQIPSPGGPPPQTNLLAPGQNSPPRKSEFYDSFLDGYIDSYNDGRKSKVFKGEPADMASNNSHDQAGRQGYAHSNNQYSRSNQQHMEDDYYNSRSNQRGNGSPDRYTDSRQQQHAPYRDMTPSPDLHPGFKRQSPPRFASNNRSDDNRANTPSRQGDAYDHRDRNIPKIGIPPVGASSPFADPTRSANSPTQYTAYNPSFTPDQRGQEFESGGRNSPFTPYAQNPLAASSHASYSSTDPLTGAGAGPARNASPFGNRHGPGMGSNSRTQSPHPLIGSNVPNHPYQNPYDAHSISRNNLNGMDYIDPNALADDGDEGLEYHNPKRRSVLGLNRRSLVGSNPSLPGTAPIGAGGAAGVAGVAGAGALPLESMAKLTKSNTLPGSSRGVGSNAEKFSPERGPIKSTKNKFWKRFLFIGIVVIILGAIATGVVVGLLKRGSSNGGVGSGSGGGSGSNSEADGGTDSGDLDLKSPSVAHLLNNKNLHKVFMGMAYTPMNAQYPDCINAPPIQNNVTLDLAVLGQLTNTLRLYGTDCNQTAMVLHAIDKLQLKDMKIWAGIWLNNNVTTNNRQIKQFWDIIDTYGTKHLKGVIVGNEVLFREDLSLVQLQQYVTDVRANLTSRNVNLPVASADLGDNWTADFASKVDVVMSNVHPFFAGVKAEDGASWAWSFWQTHDVILTPDPKQGQQVISEIGWPSEGGNDCGTTAGCPNPTDGAIAGIPQMNTFMNSWVCQAMANSTQYFWFEGYDEPWKQIFDEPNKAWEDHWGLLTVNRDLKSGVVIPSCNGQTVPAA